MPEKKFTWKNLRNSDFEDIVREVEKESIARATKGKEKNE